MAFSTVGIANLACLNLGVQSISAWPETTSPQGRALYAAWEYILEEVLEAHAWNFCKERAELVQSSTAPVFGYDYKYAKPYDCITVLDVVQQDTPIDYEVEGDYILSDTDNTSYPIYIKYCKRVTDTAKFSGLFATALAYRLAAEVAPKLKSDKQTEMIQGYEWALLSARGHNQRPGSVTDEEGVSSWRSAGR